MHRDHETKVLVNLGNSFFSQGKYGDAITNYRAATEVSIDNCQAFFNWGNALRRQENHDEAILKYRRALDINPKLSQAYNNWGLCLIDQEKYLEAAHKFEKAVEINPKFAQAYNNWGLALNGHHEYKLSTLRFKKAIELNPNFTDAYYNLGNALCLQSQYDEAIKNFARAIEIQPNHSKAYQNWGAALASRENNEEAIKKYKKAIEINPEYTEAYNNWALILYKEKKYHEAVQVFVKGLKFVGVDSQQKHELVHFFEHQLKEDENTYSTLNNEAQKNELKAKIDGIHTILTTLSRSHHLLQPPQESNTIPGRSSPISPLEIPRSSISEDTVVISTDFRVAEYQKFVSEELSGLLARVITIRDNRGQDEAEKLISLLTFASTFIPPLYASSFDEKVFPVISRIAPDGILMEDVITIRRVNRTCQQFAKHFTSTEDLKQVTENIVNKLTNLRKDELIRDYTKAVNPRTFMKVRQAKIKDLTTAEQVMSKAQELAFFDTVMIFVFYFLEGLKIENYSNSSQKIENISKAAVNNLQTLLDELKLEKKNLTDWCNTI